MIEKYDTVCEDNKIEYIEKKSKFITNIFKVNSQEEAEEIIKKVKKENRLANHNCSAYRILKNNNIIEKCSDDGEPSGTAGLPMLNILQKNNLAQILVIVTRYFGGILLGTGGLVRAYSESTKLGIENSKIVNKQLGEELTVILDYKEYEIFQYYCKNNNINITKTTYLENIVCNIEVTMDNKEKIKKKIELKELKILDISDGVVKYI